MGTKLFKYVVSQPAHVDVDGTGRPVYLSAGDPVVLSEPAGKEFNHILTPVNEVARAKQHGDDTPYTELDFNTLNTLLELEEIDVAKLKQDVQAKFGKKLQSKDPGKLVEQLKELSRGAPPEKVKVGMEDEDAGSAGHAGDEGLEDV